MPEREIPQIPNQPIEPLGPASYRKIYLEPPVYRREAPIPKESVVIEGAMSGKTAKDIGEQIGRAGDTVEAYLRRLRQTGDLPPLKRGKVIPTERLKELKNEGRSVKDIALALGLHKHTVYAYLKILKQRGEL